MYYRDTASNTCMCLRYNIYINWQWERIQEKKNNCKMYRFLGLEYSSVIHKIHIVHGFYFFKPVLRAFGVRNARAYILAISEHLFKASVLFLCVYDVGAFVLSFPPFYSK